MRFLIEISGHKAEQLIAMAKIERRSMRQQAERIIEEVLEHAPVTQPQICVRQPHTAEMACVAASAQQDRATAPDLHGGHGYVAASATACK
jgi:hypothetical protein